MYLKAVGDRIRQQRKIKGMTQEELAKAVNLSTMSIRRYEGGERIISEDTLRAIASALEVSVAYLLGQDEHHQWSWYLALRQKLSHIGYSIGFYEEDAFLWINYPDGMLEVTEEELKDLNNSVDSYLRFKLGELKEAHKGQFKPK
ncbi:MAG: helix-turn-helix domain-containing protein [Evtepia sp.]